MTANDPKQSSCRGAAEGRLTTLKRHRGAAQQPKRLPTRIGHWFVTTSAQLACTTNDTPLPRNRPSRAPR
jgi:hypothetical protein